jgi:lipopolysaccharide assembly outer membrane protein LptD (OstA)
MGFPSRSRSADTVATAASDSALHFPDSLYQGLPPQEVDTLIAEEDSGALVVVADELIAPDSLSVDSLAVDSLSVDSLAVSVDSLAMSVDSMALDSLSAEGEMLYDSLGRRYYGEPFIDDIVTSSNTDSLVYDVKTRKIRLYKEVNINMQDQQAELKNSDFVEIDMASNMIYAQGATDSVGLYSRPTFVDKGHEYDMDSISYNLQSQKMKIRGVWTTEGEGFLRAAAIKKMPDNSLNLAFGDYTTCDAEHPHFVIRMNRGKTIPGQKTIFQYAYLEIENVPIPFLAIPFGFFPMNSEKSSGFIMPSFGEENVKGFYLRDIGYQYAPNDYMNLKLLGSVYTLGSWEGSLQSQYRLRYKFDGSFNFRFSDNKFGDKGSDDFHDTKTYSIQWQHRQDPKSGINFSASVNFTSSQANKYAPGSISDFAQNQTNSSISYSKNWAGTPFSMSASIQHSQINRDTTVSFTLPSLSFNMSRINPFKFKNRKPGPERWYEKIALSYSGSLSNQVSGVKEYNLFKPEMFRQLETSMSHNLPVSASFTLFNYINITPNISYREDWNTRRYERRWDAHEQRQVTDTVFGFNRVYQYSGSVSANTTIYGLSKARPGALITQMRHTLTPNVSFSLRPDFGKEKYGFYKWVQSNAAGDYTSYSPYRGAPGRGAQASMNFSLSQTLEAKVRSKTDSVGTKKVKIIDNFSFSFNYNFLADSLKLSPSIPVTFRSTLFPGFNINLTTSLGITDVDANGRPINRYFWQNSSGTGLPRIERLGTSFNKSFSFGKGDPNARNTNSNITDPNNLYNSTYDPMNPFNDPTLAQLEDDEQQQENLMAYRNLLTSQYYDFSVPLNLNFSYSINYTNNGVRKQITQTASFGASVNLTPKWGITINSGFDFVAKRIIPTTSFNLTRDLHCMQMDFNWIPLGPMKSWNFRINVKANMLKDLKYEKSGSRYDELLFDR